MTTRAPLVVACDESGNDGENLLVGSSPVFAHASVTISADAAAEIMAGVRAQTRSQSVELKSKTILQPKQEATARWLLEHPLLTEAVSVHLTHKRYLVVSKLFDSTVEELARNDGYDMYADGSALAAANILFFLAPSAYGTTWDDLLLSFQQFLRAKTPTDAASSLTTLQAAFAAVLSHESPLGDFVSMAFAGIAHLGSLSDLQLGQGIDHRLRTLDPLIPAVGATVLFWAEKENAPVELVHDAASELTPERINAIKHYLARPEIVSPQRAGRGVALTNLALVDSQHDVRVQVADLVAGLARAAGEQLTMGKEHPLFTAIEPIISQYSIWPAERLMNPEEARAVATRA